MLRTLQRYGGLRGHHLFGWILAAWLHLLIGGIYSPLASQEARLTDSIGAGDSPASLLESARQRTGAVELYSHEWQVLALLRADLLLTIDQPHRALAVADSVRRVAGDSLRYEASDFVFHSLNLSHELDRSLEYAQAQANAAERCWQRARWHADLALTHERLATHDSARFYARSALTSSCASKLGSHRYTAAISQGRAFRAEGRRDSAMHYAGIAVQDVPSIEALIESTQLFLEAGPCNESWSAWQGWSDSLRTLISSAGTEHDYFRFAITDAGLLSRFAGCASTFQVKPDSLLRLAEEYVQLGRDLDQPPKSLIGIESAFSAALMKMDELDHALKVVELPLREGAYPSRQDSLHIRFLKLISRYQLFALDGDYEEALDDAEELQAIAQDLGNETLAIVADIERGEALLQRQQPTQALEYLRHAEKALGEVNTDEFVTTLTQRGIGTVLEPERLLQSLYQSLGTALRYQHRYRAAERRFEQALEHSHTAEDSAIVLSSVAALRREQSDSMAADSLRRRVQRHGGNRIALPGVTPTVSSVLDQLTSDNPAIRRRGWAVSDSLLNDPDFQGKPYVRAQLHSMRGDYLLLRYFDSDSIGYRVRAFEEAKRAIDLLEDDHRDSFSWMLVNQTAAMASTESSEAARFAREAVRSGREIESLRGVIQAARFLANTEVTRGNYATADSAFNLAIMAAESMRFRSARDRQVRRSLMGDDLVSSVYRDAVAYSAARHKPWKSFLIAELSKARGLSDMLLEAHVSSASESPVPDRDSVSDPSSAREHAELNEGKALVADVRDGLSWSFEAADVDSAYLSAFQRGMRATFGEDSLKRRLTDLDAAVLSYYRAGPALLTWVMAGDSIWVYADSLDAGRVSGLTERIAGSSATAKGRQSRAAIRAKESSAATALYRLLVAPVESRLSRVDAENLIIIPHDVLYRVPFSSLGPKDGPTLSDRYTTTVLPALHLLGLPAENDRPSGEAGQFTFLGVGDASGSLFHSKDELQDAARHFLDATVLTDSHATEGQVRKQWKTANVLHFAAHAVANDSVINDGYVRLAPTAEEDGYLTVEEVLNARPLAARVAVLSACQTGRGALLDGEGVMGFGRAFMASGAEAVIVTLWPMDDRVAHYFTSRFYRAWRSNGMAVPEAFAAAQQATRNRFPAVHDWAGFVLLARDW